VNAKQRAVWLGLAAAVLVVAAFVIGRPGGDDEEAPERAASTPTATAESTPETAEATETPTPTPTPTATPRPEIVLRPGALRTVRTRKNRTVRFSVRSPRDEELHVHGYDITRALPAGRTVRLRFKATLEGIYEMELHGSGEQIGRLRVDPS
jgi:hypothetical protein